MMRGRELATGIAIWILVLAATALISMDDIETGTPTEERSE